jgi:hypothetical protein
VVVCFVARPKGRVLESRLVAFLFLPLCAFESLQSSQTSASHSAHLNFLSAFGFGHPRLFVHGLSSSGGCLLILLVAGPAFLGLSVLSCTLFSAWVGLFLGPLRPGALSLFLSSWRDLLGPAAAPVLFA